jgi:hypothetical protein
VGAFCVMKACRLLSVAVCGEGLRVIVGQVDKRGAVCVEGLQKHIITCLLSSHQTLSINVFDTLKARDWINTFLKACCMQVSVGGVNKLFI